MNDKKLTQEQAMLSLELRQSSVEECLPLILSFLFSKMGITELH